MFVDLINYLILVLKSPNHESVNYQLNLYELRIYAINNCSHGIRCIVYEEVFMYIYYNLSNISPTSFSSVTFRIQYANSHSSSTLVNPRRNLMFFVSCNTLQPFQIFEEFRVAKTISCLVPFNITSGNCLKSPPKTMTLLPKLKSYGLPFE